MSVVLNPYIHFDGNAAEAIEFYKNVFGGEAEIHHFDEFGGENITEEYKNQVMHSVVKNDVLQLMISDSGPMGQGVVGDNVTIAISGDEGDKLTSYFNGLSEGGNVTQPLEQHPWGATFGMLVDKFGIHWMVNIDNPQN